MSAPMTAAQRRARRAWHAGYLAGRVGKGAWSPYHGPRYNAALRDEWMSGHATGFKDYLLARRLRAAAIKGASA